MTDSPTDSPSPTATDTPQPLVLTGCASDDTLGWPASGSLTINPCHSFVPLCNGWIIVGDTTLNQIKLVNVGGWTGPDFPLTASPNQLAYDSVNGILYVSMVSSSEIARVNLQTGAQTEFPVGGTPNYLAMGPSGELFVSFGDYPTSVLAVNGATGNVDATVSASVFNGALAFDSVHNELFVADYDAAPGDIDGYAYTPATPGLTLNQTLSHTIDNYFPYPIAVSPDGMHLAADVESISDLHYNGYSDINPQNINTWFGKWADNAYAFSPDSLYVAAASSSGSNGSISVSNVSQHLPVQVVSSSSWSDLEQVGQVEFSRGGGLVYALASAYGGSTASIWWTQFDPSPTPTPTPEAVPLASIDCSSDSVASLPAGGTIALGGPAADMVPLCSGLLITENQAKNTVLVQDSSGNVLSTFALPAMPCAMALDAPDGLLYVACDSDDDLVQLNLVAGTMAQIPLSGPAWSVAVGSGTQGFVSLDTGTPGLPIAVFDGSAKVVDADSSTNCYLAPQVEFGASSSSLFLADSGGDLEQMLFNPGTLALTENQEIMTQPGCEALSPDGLHLAANSGSGLEEFIDYSAAAFSTTYGDWPAPNYPKACAFSPGGGQFLGADTQNLYVYDATTHAVDKTISLGSDGFGIVSNARFSRGGSLVYGLEQLNGATNAQIVWTQYP
jgi:hypothetical protein